VPSAPAIAWVTEAASLIVYLALACVVAPRNAIVSGVTGTLVWVPKGTDGAGRPPVVHAALLVQPTSTTHQEVCIELMPHLPADDPLRHHMELVLQTACEAEGVAGRLYAATLADALAMHVLRRYAGCGPVTPPGPSGLAPAKLRRVTAYIAAHLADPLPLVTLAAVAQLSPDHFARLFKQATGQTPHQYVLWCRMEHAKQLLAETDTPLSMIGLEVGCTDHSAFTALFRKHSAMTPKAYRAAAQKT
jgi:AraC-like DNA-binding protein